MVIVVLVNGLSTGLEAQGGARQGTGVVGKGGERNGKEGGIGIHGLGGSKLDGF